MNQLESCDSFDDGEFGVVCCVRRAGVSLIKLSLACYLRCVALSLRALHCVVCVWVDTYQVVSCLLSQVSLVISHFLFFFNQGCLPGHRRIQPVRTQTTPRGYLLRPARQHQCWHRRLHRRLWRPHRSCRRLHWRLRRLLRRLWHLRRRPGHPRILRRQQMPL